MIEHLQREDMDLFALISKGIWKRRNGVVHEGLFTHPNVIMLEAMEFLQQY